MVPLMAAALPQIDALHRQGQAAYPDITVSGEDFAAFMEGRDPGGPAADLYLCCACLLSAPRALAAFDALYLAQVPQMLAGRCADAPADEVQQLLREKLLCPSGASPPRLSGYTGRGALRGFVRSAALRTAIDLLRGRRQGENDEAVLHIMAAADDPEQAYLKKRCRREFKEALEAAFAELSAEERNLLRFALVQGLTVQAIGRILHISHPTVVRRLQAIRAGLRQRTCRILRDRLDLGPEDMDTMVRLVQSQLDLSLHRLLQIS